MGLKDGKAQFFESTGMLAANEPKLPGARSSSLREASASSSASEEKRTIVGLSLSMR